MTNTIIGGGILALPFAFANSGFAVGIALVVIIGALSWLTSGYLATLSRYCMKSTGRSYRAVAQRAFGFPGAFTVDVAFTLFLFGGCVGYVVIMGDILTPYFEQLTGWTPKPANRFLVEAIMTLCFAYPLCLLKRIDALKYTSFLALVCICYLVIVIVAASSNIIVDNFDAGNINLAAKDLSVFQAFPVITFAFTFHMQQFAIQNEMKRPGRIRLVVGCAIGFSMVCYLLVGVFGYLAFFESAASNVLLSFDNSPAITVGKIALVVVIMFSFPVLHYPLRESLMSLIFPKSDQPACYDWCPASAQPQFRQQTVFSSNEPVPSLFDDGSVGSYPSDEEYLSPDDSFTGDDDAFPTSSSSSSVPLALPCRDELTRRVIVTTCTVYIIYLVAIAIPDISSIFGLVGSTVGTILVFVLPSILIIKLRPGRLLSLEKIVALILAIVGTFIGIISTYETIVNW